MKQNDNEIKHPKQSKIGKKKKKKTQYAPTLVATQPPPIAKMDNDAGFR